jgi:hypothetical protein
MIPPAAGHHAAALALVRVILVIIIIRVLGATVRATTTPAAAASAAHRADALGGPARVLLGGLAAGRNVAWDLAAQRVSLGDLDTGCMEGANGTRALELVWPAHAGRQVQAAHSSRDIRSSNGKCSGNDMHERC